MNNTWWFNLVNVSTWFLPALFLTSLYYFWINKFIKNKNIKIIFLLIISIILFIESKLTIFRLPWSAEIALMMTVFYWLANIFKKEIFTFVEKVNLKYLFFLVPIIAVHLFFLNSINASTNYYWNYFWLILNSLLWFLTILIIAKNIWKNKILDFLWKNSIIILWFEWIKELMVWRINYFYNSILNIEWAYLLWITQFIFTVILLIPIIIIINKYLPFIIWTWYKNNVTINQK